MCYPCTHTVFNFSSPSSYGRCCCQNNYLGGTHVHRRQVPGTEVYTSWRYYLKVHFMPSLVTWFWMCKGTTVVSRCLFTFSTATKHNISIQLPHLWQISLETDWPDSWNRQEPVCCSLEQPYEMSTSICCTVDLPLQTHRPLPLAFFSSSFST